MSRIKIIPILLLATIMGSCSKIEPTLEGDGSGDETTTAISLGTTASWATKGAAIDELSDVEELTLYSFDAYAAGSWWDVDSSDDLAPFFTTTTTPLTLTTSDEGATWDYTSTTGGLRYWRADNKEAITFIAFYPSSELDVSFDETSGKPVFDYTMLGLAGENDDLIVDAIFDLNNSVVNGEKVNFELEHVLTKLTLNAMLDGVCADDESYSDVKYAINGITIYNLYGYAELVIGSDGTTSWSIDESKATMELTATQGVTFLSVDDDDAGLNGSTATDVMAKATEADLESGTEATKDQAIFVLPQGLGTSRTDAAPSVKVRIRKSFTDDLGGPQELIYETNEIEIPAATGDTESSWKAGTHYALSFVFDISKLDEYATPLTLTSTIYDWTETTVDVDVHPNTYMYASTDLFEVDAAATYADMIICTNYEYDLRRHRRKYELDGTATEAAGFTYYALQDETYTVDDDDIPTIASWDDYGVALEPVLLWDNSGDFGSKEHDYSDLTPYTYTYIDNELYITNSDDSYQLKLELDDDGYFDPTPFEDAYGWMYFAIQPDPNDSDKDFYYKVKKETRVDLDMYTNTAVNGDTSYGINKSEDDAVYTLRLNITEAHLDITADNGYGYFFGKVGAEAISNGGGLVTTKFRVTLKKELQ